MRNQTSLNMLTEKKDQSLPLSDTIKSEVNFLVFPFFALSRKGLRNKTVTEYREVVKRGEEQLELIWNVSANPKYGYPGPFDRNVYKAIEQIISEILHRDGKVANPVALGSLYSLCKRMGVQRGKSIYEEIKQTLRRIRATSIESRGTFYSKEKRKWIEDAFSLYERVVFQGTELPNGEIADTNYVFLGSWYLESLNAFYVKPLDYKYLKSLESNIASRLYEILGVRFYGLQNKRQSYIWFDYRILCELLPITRQRHFSAAKQKLASAHNELIATRFLSEVRWEKKSKTEWLIHYYPGERAEEELKSRPVQERLQLEAPQELPSDTSEDTPDQQKLLLALVKRGVGKRQASRLVRDHSDWIKRGIELWELERRKNPDGMKNPAGYLVSIIKAGEDWQPPDDYVSPEEKKERQEKKRRDELVEELVSLTDDDTPPSPLLTKSEKEPTIEEFEQEIASIKAEKEKRKQEEKAAIQKVLAAMTAQELKELKEEVLDRADDFHKTRSVFGEISQKDMRDWGDKGLTEIYLRALRDLIIRERYLKGNT